MVERPVGKIHWKEMLRAIKPGKAAGPSEIRAEAILCLPLEKRKFAA